MYSHFSRVISFSIELDKERKEIALILATSLIFKILSFSKPMKLQSWPRLLYKHRLWVSRSEDSCVTF